MADRAFLLVPAQAFVAQWFASFKEFPIRQKSASFNLDEVMEKLSRRLHRNERPPLKNPKPMASSFWRKSSAWAPRAASPTTMPAANAPSTTSSPKSCGNTKSEPTSNRDRRTDGQLARGVQRAREQLHDGGRTGSQGRRAGSCGDRHERDQQQGLAADAAGPAEQHRQQDDRTELADRAGRFEVERFKPRERGSRAAPGSAR